MAISLGSDLLLAQNTKNSAASTRAEKLSASLDAISEGKATDEELMNACKSFENYLVEQVIKQTKEAMLEDKDSEGEYMKFFGDNLTGEYARLISESSNLGIAQMLFEASKRNQS